MNHYKLPPSIEQSFQRIGLIYEAYKACSSYSANTYVLKRERDIGRNSMPLYRTVLMQEIDFMKNILLEEMEKDKDLSGHDLQTSLEV